MQAVSKSPLLLFFFLIITQIAFGQKEYRPYPGARLQSNPLINFTDFPPAFSCTFEADFENNFSIREAAATDYNTIDIVMPLVGDITGDGIPEIIIPAKPINIGADNDGYGRPYFTSRTKDLLVYRMTPDEQLVQVGRITTPYISLESPTQYVLAKIPGVGNGNPLIIVAGSWDPDNIHGGVNFSSRLVAYQWNGAGFNQVWISDQQYGRNVPRSIREINNGNFYFYRSGGAPAVADFNSDGKPEVYIYNEIFDASTGRFIVDGGKNRIVAGDTIPRGQGISQISPGNTNEMMAGTLSVSVAADMNNNGRLELAAGNTIYEVNIAAKTMNPLYAPNTINGQFPRDGFTSVADIDGDGQLDVVVTTSRFIREHNTRQLYIWTLPGTGSPLANGLLKRIPDVNSADFADVAISLPFIGDVNGDGRPNIGFTTGRRLWMLNYNAGALNGTWGPDFIGTNDLSGYTLITMFDFDQDGKQEIVYRDEENIRIIDGRDGSDLFSFPSYSITAGEGAIVADVDLDGEAEILVTDRGRIWNSGTFEQQLDRSARLVVYKSVDKPWAPARRVWNQYPYFSFNVNEDLTIPSPQINHATIASVFFPRFDEFGCLTGNAQPFNSFLVQTTLYNDAGCTTVGINQMDAEIEVLNTRWLCPLPDSQIEAVLNLINASDAIGDLEASVPKETPVAFYVDGVFIGQKTLEQLGVGNIAPGDSEEVTVILNSSVTDNLSGSQVFTAIINWDHEAQDFVYDECIYDNERNRDLITRPIYSLNSPPSQCFEDEVGTPSLFTLIPTNTVDGSIDSEQLKWYLNDLTGAPLATGGAYIIDDTDFSLTATGLAEGTYLFILLDECTNETTERIITVDPLPKPVFTYDDADCYDIESGQIFVENDLPTYAFYISGTLFDGEDFPVTKFSSKAELEGAFFKAGDYSIRTVNEDGTNCEIVSLISLDHPEAILFLNIEEVDPSCVPDNGSISWSMKGGTSTGTFPFYHYILTNITTSEVIENLTIIDLGDNEYKIENLIGGEYTLTAEDGQGCPVSENFSLIPQEDAVFDLPENVITCYGEEVIVSVDMTSPGQPAIDPGYIWGVIEGGNFTAISDGATTNGGVAAIAPDGKSLTLTNLLPNTTGYEYAVRFTDACDFPDAIFSVIVNPLPEAAFENGTVSCFGGSDGVIEMSQAPTGSTTGFTYVLDGPVSAQNETGDFSGLPEGTYMITVTNNETGCVDVFENIIIYEPEPITEGDSGATEVTCGLENNGTAFFEFSGGTLPYTFIGLEKDGVELTGITHEATEDRFDFSELEPGDYVLIAVDANDCPLPLVTVTVGEIPIPVLELSTNDICFGETLEIFASLIDAGGLTDPTYTWISSDGQELTGTTGSLNLGGTYQLVPGTGINPSGLILEGISNSLDSYEFILQVRGELSCDINESISFKVNPLPETTFEVDDATCFDSSTGKISVSNDEPTYEYIVSGVVFEGSDFPETNFANKTALEDATFKAGSYTIITLNVDGTNCQIISEVEIDQPAEILLIEADASPVTCDGIDNGSAYFEFQGGTKPYELISLERDGVEIAAGNFTINGGRFDFSDLEVGTYSINSVDANGCPLPVSEVVVSEIPVPDVELEVEDVCFGEVVTIVASLIDEGGLTSPEYIWVSPDGQRLTGSGSLNLGGTYDVESVTGLVAPNLVLTDLPDSDVPYIFTLELRGELSCDKDFAIEFFVHPIPAAILTKEDIACFDDQTGKILVDNHLPTYAYYVSGTMYDGSVFAETKYESDTELEDATFKAGDYSIRTVNENGTDCENIVEITIEQAEPIVFIEKGVDPVFCEGVDNGRGYFEFSGGTLPYEVISLERDGQPVTDATITILGGTFELTNLSVGTYTLNAIDALGCPLPVETIVVEELPVPVIELATSDQCFGDLIQISADLVEAGGLTNPEYIWVSADGQVLSGASGTLTIGGTFEIVPATGIQPPAIVLENLPAGDAYEFTLQVRGELSCDKDFSTFFTVFPAPDAEFQVLDATCFDTETGKITVEGDVPSYSYFVSGTLFDESNYPETQFTSAGDLENANFKAGTYSIRITDSAGLDCESIRELIIDQPTPIEVVSKEATPTTCDIFDSGSLVFEFTGGTAPYEFVSLERDGQVIVATPNISNGRFEFTGLEIGDYILNAIDANGCPFPAEELSIGAVPVPEVVISTGDRCFGELITLTADLVQQGSAINPEYTWVSSDGQVLTGTSGTLTIGGTYEIIQASGVQPPTLVLDRVPAGEGYEFTLQLRGELSCEGDFTTTFSVFPAPVAEFEALDATCFDTETGKITVQGDEPTYSYFVSGTLFDGANYPESQFTSATDLENAAFKAGSYSIRITDTAGLDCESIREITIEQPAPIELVSKEATPTTCDVFDSGSLVFEFTGGTAPYEFVSLERDGQVIGATPNISDGRFVFTGLEVADYVLNAIDANGCPFPVEALSIGAVPVPEVEITTNDQCFGELITLTADLVQQGSATNPEYTWISSDGQVLTGASGTLTIGGTYEIIPPSGVQPPTLFLDKVPAGDGYEFTLQLRGELSCERDFTTTFSVFPAPLAEFEALDATCFDTETGKITVQGGEPTYSYFVSGTLFDGTNYTETQFTSAADLESETFKAGSYSIRITDSAGLDCESIREVTIDQPAQIELVSKEATPTTCDIFDSGSLVFEFTGGTAPYEFVSLEKDGQVISATPNISSGRFEFTGLEIGEYVLNAIDANGCPIPAEALSIGAVPVPEVTINTIDQCYGELITLTAELVQQGSATNPEYTWVSSDGQVLTGASGTLTIGGTYQITAGSGIQPPTLVLDRVPAGEGYEFTLQLRGELSCEGDFTTTFSVFPAPLAEFTALDATCFDTETGKITVQDDKPTYSYFVSGTLFDGANYPETQFTSAAELESAGFKAGSYSIRITDTAGLDCESKRTITIDQPVQIELVSKEATPTSCDIFDSGSLVFEFKGGTAPYEFVSLEKDGQVISATPTISNGRFEFTGLEVGDYVLNAIDANGCPFPAEGLTIGAVPVPEIEIQTNDHCYGELTTITANLVQAGGMTQPVYTWVSSDGQILSGTSGTLSIGGTYQIQSGSGMEPSTLILDRVPAATTPYEFTLQLRGNLSCDNDFPVSFVVNPAPIAEFSTAPVTCFDTETGKIIVEDDQPTYRYYVTGTTFDGASYVETLFASANALEEATFKAGTYTIRVIDVDGADCESLRNVVIEQPEELSLVASGSGPVTCDGDQLGYVYFEYTGGTAPYTFVSLALDGTILNGVTHPATERRFEFRDLEAGEYTLMAIDANGCELPIDTVIVENLPTPDFALEAMDVCFGENVILSATLLEKGGVVAPVYTWVASDGQRLTAVSGNLALGGTYEVVAGTGNNPPKLLLKNVPASDNRYEFTLELRGDFSCDRDFGVDFQVNPAPDPELVVENILCYGEETGSIFVSQRGQATYLYAINGATPISQVEMEARGFTAGIYEIVISSSEFECITTRQVEITQPEPIVVTAIEKEDPTCDEANGLIEFSVTGGVSGYTVNVNGSNIETYPDYSINGDVYQLRDLLPGSYQIEVIDQNGCLAILTETFELTNIDGAPITIEPLEDLVCEGNPLIFIPSITSTGNQKPIMRWYKDENLSQLIISNYTPGGTGIMYDIDQVTGQLKVYNHTIGEYTYYLRLSGPEYCTTTAIAIGEVIPGLSADVEATDLVCFGDENGTITITSVSGGSGDFEYSLDGSTWQTANIFNDLTEGEYTVSIKDVGSSSNCTLEIPNVVVAEPAGPIEISDDPVIIGVGCGQDNGEITNIQISGGWGNYTYVWKYNDVNATTNFAENTLSLKGLATGTYYLIVTDEKGCEAITEFVIKDLPDPNFEKVEVDEFCEADDIKLRVINTVSGSAPTEVIWSKGPNQTNPISEGEDPAIPGLVYTFGSELNNYYLDLSGVQAGTYTYYFYAVCTDQEIRFDFIVKDSPEPEFDTIDLTCDPDSFGSILVLPGYENDWRYSIDGGNTYLTKDQLEAIELSAGDYEVLSINSIDCPGVPKIITIGIPNPLQAELIEYKDSACGTDNGSISIAIQGGTPTYTIDLFKDSQLFESITTNANTYTFTDLGPGAYIFEVNDAVGCSDVLNDGVDIVDGPSDIVVDDVVVCVGEDVVLRPEVFPTVANPQFTWFFGTLATGNEITNNQTIEGATYTFNANGALIIRGLAADAMLDLWVTVSGDGVCEGAEKLVKVSVDSQPEFTAEAENETCFGGGGLIKLIPLDSTEVLVYSLNGGAYQAYADNIIEDLAPGSYTISAMNEAGCTYELPEAIVVEGPISRLEIVDVFATNSSCDVANGTLSGRINGGTPMFEIGVYDTSGRLVGSLIKQSATQFLFEGLPSGEYTIRVTDENGCVDESSAVFIRSVEVEIGAHNAEICEGDVAEINASISSTVENAQFKWYYDAARQNAVTFDGNADQFGGTYRSNEFGQISMAGLPGRDEPYIFFLDLEADGVCPPEMVEVRVRVNPLPTLRVSNPSIVCDPTETVDLTQFIEGFNPTVFDYIVTAPNGNTLRMEDLKNVSLTGSYTVQAGFRGSTCMTATERIAVVISNNKLEAYFQFEVKVAGASEPLVDGEVQAGEPIQFKDLSEGNVIIWNWEFGDGNFSSEQHPIHQYEEEGEYIVRLTTIDEFGCTDLIERRIIVFDDYLVIIPNAFTPGGNQNQHFFPKFRGIATMEFMVFNTWGDLIYVTDNLEERGWDGTLNGINAPNGNYVYKAKFLSRTGHSFTRTGVFILIR